jgi:hypothetical protein
MLGFLALLCTGTGIWIGLVLGGGGASSSAPSTSGASPNNDLFVLDADSGTATPSGGAGWQIQLSNPRVLWFLDRPARDSGSLPIGLFISNWSSLFPGPSPYGAIVAPDGPSGHSPTAVKLINPSYDPKSNVATFTISLDAGESSKDAAWLSKLTSADAARNGRLVLFIDNSGKSVQANSTTNLANPGSPAELSCVTQANLVLQTVQGNLQSEENALQGGAAGALMKQPQNQAVADAILRDEIELISSMTLLPKLCADDPGAVAKEEGLTLSLSEDLGAQISQMTRAATQQASSGSSALSSPTG